jgi:predicted TIM-barrel fold metal-dependent hydrolase
MIIDMHCTIVPAADDPAAAAMAVLPHTQFDPATCTVDATLARMDAAGVDRSVVWCLGASLDACRSYNDFVAKAAADHPDRFIPFATAHPAGGEAAVAEVHRAATELGMAGLKLHPDVFAIPIDDERFLALLGAARELGLAFVTHVHPTLIRELPDGADDADDPITTTPRPTYSSADRVGALLATWDSPRVQLAHMGAMTRPDVRAASVTFQTAGASAEAIRVAIATVGIERIVFGADYPFFSPESEIAKITGLGLDQAATARMLSGNALERVLAAAPAN